MVDAPLIHMIIGDPKLGAVNGYVALLQRFLVINGILTSTTTGIDPVNGKFDRETAAAVDRIPGSSGSDSDSGRVTGKTWAAIAGVSTPLAVVAPNSNTPFLPLLLLDDTGSLVTVLQRLLVEYSGSLPGEQTFIVPGLTKADIDGYFGETTKVAVTAFQGNRGLLPDGKVGNNTWEKLLFPKQRLSSPGIPLPVIPRDPAGG